MQTIEGNAGQKIYSLENELQQEITVECELVFQTPNRADKALLGAYCAAFELHLFPLEGSRLY